MKEFIFVLLLLDLFPVTLQTSAISNFSCDFTSSLCNWKLVNNRTRFKWVYENRPKAPYTDHTGASPSGSYVYIDSHVITSVAGDIAKLESGPIIATEQQCFSFWYFTTNTRDSVRVFQNKDKLEDLSYNNYGTTKWHHIRIPLTSFNSYQIVFKVTRRNDFDGSFGAIAIDDILIENKNCDLEESTTVSAVATSYWDSGAAEDSYTVSPVVTSIGDVGAAKESTTISLDITSIQVSGAVTVEGVPLPPNENGSSDSEIGLVAGLVVAGLLLICLVVLIVFLVRKRGSNEKVRDELRENDYIGCQDIALPQTAGRSNHMQNVGMYGQRSSINTTTNTEINNVQQTGHNTSAHKEFQSPPHVVRLGETFADNKISHGDEYAIVGPIAETSLSKTIHSRTGTSDSALFLEPTVTGLNRTQLSYTSTDYEFAKPVLETENTTDDEDQYALSEEGVYDHSGNNRHRELEDSIYNHAIDNIYDSGSHKRNDDDKDDTYDHFFGQKQ